jgi:hypothetical protein
MGIQMFVEFPPFAGNGTPLFPPSGRVRTSFPFLSFAGAAIICCSLHLFVKKCPFNGSRRQSNVFRQPII